MGTSHRHTPTIHNQPNWGDASSAMTGVATAIDESDKLEKNPPKTLNPSQISKKQSSLDKRIRSNYHRVVRNWMRAVGGRSRVSSGTTKAVGYSGVIMAGGLASVFQEIISNGLDGWLKSRGIESLEGKKCQDILDIIRQYLDTGVAGLDNTAANEALEHILDILGSKMGDDATAYDGVMNEILSAEGIKDLLDEFFGIYIFSHLSQNFKEKLEYDKGTETMCHTMEEIKDLIVDDIRIARSGRSARSIDWSTPDGEAFIKEEFDRILYILSGNED